MGGSVFLTFIFAVFVFTFIFWLLIYLTRYLFANSVSSSRNVFYECGFKAYESIDFKLNTGILFISILLILYDIEFLFLLPVFSNISIITPAVAVFTVFILSLIALLLYIDNLFLFLYWSN